jgi:hypothetical protein
MCGFLVPDMNVVGPALAAWSNLPLAVDIHDPFEPSGFGSVKGLSIWEHIQWAGLIDHPFKAPNLDTLDDDLLLALEFECTNSMEIVAELREQTELMITTLWQNSLTTTLLPIQNPLQRVINVPFIQVLLEKSGYLRYDPSLAEDINGFFLLGHLPPPGPDSRPRIQSRFGRISIEDLVQSREERNRKLVRTMRPSEWDDDLMDLAIEEASIGCNSEPRILTHEDMLAYTLCRRIPVREERASGWRTRAVDDETEAGINPATFQDHATLYDDISKLDIMSRFCLEKGAPFTMWKRDVSKAFRKIMISQLHLKFAASIFCWAGAIWIIFHYGMPFGSSSANSAWHRLGSAFRWIVRNLYRAPVARFVDDFFGISVHSGHWSGGHVLDRLLALSGYQCDPEKIRR